MAKKVKYTAKEVFFEFCTWMDENAGYTDYSGKHATYEVEDYQEFLKELGGKLGLTEEEIGL